jgi:hypothetical protein
MGEGFNCEQVNILECIRAKRPRSVLVERKNASYAAI